MFGSHALRWIVLAAASLIAAKSWQVHGVAAERADRMEGIQRRLSGGHLRAADELARSLIEDFGPSADAQALALRASSAWRAQELLSAHDPAGARRLIEPLAAEESAPAVLLLLLGRACQQLGDRAAADAALARFHALAPHGLSDVD